MCFRVSAPRGIFAGGLIEHEALHPLLESITLGIVQGLTEFLPVSSSGHLKAVEVLTSSPYAESLTLDIAVHFGTLMVILIYFRRDLWRTAREIPSRAEARRVLYAVVIASVPAALVGGLGRESIEGLVAGRPAVVVAGWMGTTALLVWLGGRSGAVAMERIRYHQALIVGLAQAVAILPGVSRSGATIVVGVLVGLDRAGAARFSFFLAIPAIAGASLLEFGGGRITAGEVPWMLSAAAAAGLAGWWGLRSLLGLLLRGKLWWFALYLAAVSCLFTLFLLLRPPPG